MASFITVDRLIVSARHGVAPQETTVGNRFEVSLTVEFDFLDAAACDDVNRTLNYAELTELIIEVMATPRKLLETVAVDIRNAVLSRWPDVMSGSVSITKLHPPIPAPTPRVSITLTW